MRDAAPDGGCLAHIRHVAEQYGRRAAHGDHRLLQVLDAGDDVIGCVYIYPSKAAAHDAKVSSWVRHSHAPLDRTLYEAVSAWLTDVWPFERVDYAARPSSAAR